MSGRFDCGDCLAATQCRIRCMTIFFSEPSLRSCFPLFRKRADQVGDEDVNRKMVAIKASTSATRAGRLPRSVWAGTAGDSGAERERPR